MNSNYDINPSGMMLNRVVADTYKLLALCLLLSSVAAYLAVEYAIGQGLAFTFFVLAFLAGMFVLPKAAQGTTGIPLILGISAALGASIGPMLQHYLNLSNGAEIIQMAFMGAAVIFASLSLYAIKSEKDFRFLNGLIISGVIAVLALMIFNIFAGIPLLSLALSFVVVMLMAAVILMETSNIVNGGETNYIMATYGLFLAFFNLFTSLLNILGFFSQQD